MDKLKIVKAIVFILTFLLVFGVLTVLGLLFQKTKKVNAPLPSEFSLNQPQGSTIASFKEVNGLLYILVKDGGLEDRIVVLDPSNSDSVYQIQLQGKAAHE